MQIGNMKVTFYNVARDEDVLSDVIERYGAHITGTYKHNK